MTDKKETIEVPAFKSNSHTSKTKTPARVDKQPIVSGAVNKRKKTMFERFKTIFTGDEAVDVKSYLVSDILIPALKDTLYDLGQGALDSLIYRTTGAAPSHRSRNGAPQAKMTSYGSMFSGASRRPAAAVRPAQINRRAAHDFGDITFADRRDAEMVLNELHTSIQAYGHATVMDFYQLTGLETTFIDNDYGWYDLTGSSVRHRGGSYTLVLPPPEEIL